MTAPAPAPEAALTRAGPGWRYRLESLPFERARGLAIAAGLVVTAAIVHAVNLTAAPQRLADEGDLVSRAWAVDNLRALDTGTYVYDHPPLGWLQLGAWTWLTGAFERGPTAVAAGRAAMVVAAVVSAGLVWVLARRLGLPQWAAAVAVALFGLSPLAVELHRQALLENLAVPWILAALVLACSPRLGLHAAAAAGLCVGIAVLTNETALLLAPAVALQLWRVAPAADRRALMAVAGSLFLTVCGMFVLVATLRGELVPGDGQPSLIEGAWHQVFRRPETGSLLDAGSATRDTVAGWLALDPIGPVLALVAAPAALVAVPRLAPLAVGFLTVAGMFVLVATLRGELVPGDGQPSLIEGAWHQVFRRPETGSLLDSGSATRDTVAGWLGLDPIGPVLALVAAPAALVAVPRLAPLAVGFLTVAAVVVRPGYLPPALPVLLVPVGAVLVAGVAAHAWDRWPTRGRLLAGCGAVLAVAMVVAWAGDVRDLLIRDPDEPLRAATEWLVDNVPPDQSLIVDDAIWVDLVEAGADPDQVTGYAALDADPSLGGDQPRPWRDHDVVVTTSAFRSFPAGHPELAAAVRSSIVVAAFGEGVDRVEVRRIAVSST